MTDYSKLQFAGFLGHCMRHTWRHTKRGSILNPVRSPSIEEVGF
ncbi:hypothetical protein OSTOST_17334 [Ostertagia ostertagi]